ncbi:MAG TPA: outer membrane beta-barrel protein [Burkholderiaceae bacterium]
MKVRQGLVMGALAACAAGTAGAQGLYIGGAGGATRSNADCTGTLSCDTSDSGWKAYAGYQINPMFGVEVVGYDMGATSGAIFFPGVGVINASLKTSGFGLAGVINVPLGASVDLIGRLGVASNKLTIDASSGSLSGSDSETDTQPLWGLGLAFKVTPNVAIRTEIDGTAASYAGERFDSMLFSLGLSIRF